MRTLVAAMLLTAAAVGCAAVDTSTLPRMVVEFSFAPTNTCQGISPEIRLLGVPDGVTTYDVRLTDLDVPGFHHWAQTLGAAGPVIRAGAGVGYFGPCPPSGTHRYQIEVTARDARGRPLAYGDKTVDAGR